MKSHYKKNSSDKSQHLVSLTAIHPETILIIDILLFFDTILQYYGFSISDKWQHQLLMDVKYAKANVRNINLNSWHSVAIDKASRLASVLCSQQNFWPKLAELKLKIQP